MRPLLLRWAEGKTAIGGLRVEGYRDGSLRLHHEVFIWNQFACSCGRGLGGILEFLHS
jgi:hypothetical protein